MSEINKVLKAVCQGYRTRKAISEAADLSQTATGTYLTRLMHRNLIVATGRGPGGRKPNRLPSTKQYHLRDIGCLLADFWK